MDWAALTQTLGDFYDRWSDVIYVFFIVLAVLIVNRALHWILNALVRRRNPAKHVWRDAFLGALDPPLRTIVWVIGLTIAASIFMRSGEVTMLSKLFPPARNVVAIIAVAWFFMRVVGRAEANLHARAHNRGEPIDPTAADAIGKLVRAAIIITAALVIMQTLGFSIGGLLAFGGAAGIAVGFAAQSLVANLLGGLTVFASRIFKIGDYIILPGTDLMGGVEHIGWRATRVIGFDRKPFYIPNSTFNTSAVINHSRMTSRRIMEYMHLRYRDVDKVRAIVAEANAMLAEHPGIEHDFFVLRFDSCGEFALKLFLYAFTVSTDYSDYMQVKEDILLKIADIIRKHGGDLAVPVSNVYMPEGLRIGADLESAAEDPVVAGLVENRR